MINVTPKALVEIKRLYALEHDVKYLRVMVIGGGCSGMSYKLGFDSKDPEEKDKIFEFEGVKILVDQKSHLFLNGMNLDFTDGLNGKGFVFNNPNAKRTCGCGESFSV